MYCPSCGTEYTIELKYCNRCGANLNTGIEEQPQIAPINLTRPVVAIGAIIALLTLGGFATLIAGATELSHNARIDPDSVVFMVVVGIMTILTMDILLVRQLSRIISASLSSGTVTPQKRTKVLANPAPLPLPLPLPQAPTARLSGVPSVTEGTTRFFDPYRTPAQTEGRTTSERLEK